MSNVPISGLPAATALVLSDIIPCVESATTKKATLTVLRAALMPIVNADVSASAAIAGTKIAPSFGAQDVVTTTLVRSGGGANFKQEMRPLPGFEASNGAFFILPDATAPSSSNVTVYGDGANTFLNAPSGECGLSVAGGQFSIRVNGLNNVQIGQGAMDTGGGEGVVGIDDATTVPTTDPTGGGILYAQAGALKWRGSSGTVTTVAPAEPHCPTCGRDFVLEFENEAMGDHLTLCLPCMLEGLRSLGMKTSFVMREKRSSSKEDWVAHHEASLTRKADVESGPRLKK